eukprot:6213229-Pleurochrysis_carterae.AAC.4
MSKNYHTFPEALSAAKSELRKIGSDEGSHVCGVMKKFGAELTPDEKKRLCETPSFVMEDGTRVKICKSLGEGLCSQNKGAQASKDQRNLHSHAFAHTGSYTRPESLDKVPQNMFDVSGKYLNEPIPGTEKYKREKIMHDIMREGHAQKLPESSLPEDEPVRANANPHGANNLSRAVQQAMR